MTKDEFRVLFENALEIAAQNAEKKVGHPISRNFEIELHGRSPKTRILGKEDTLDEIYLGPDRFFRIIDVAVRQISNTASTVFVGISGHPPGTWDETWNQPTGSGPFKQVLAENVSVT